MINYRRANLKDIHGIKKLIEKNMDDIIPLSHGEIVPQIMPHFTDFQIQNYLEIDNGFFGVAEEDENNENHIIGFILCYAEEFLWSSQEEFKKAYIAHFHVDINYRKKGIASQLLIEAEEWAKENEYNALYLDVFHNNVIAKEMYNKKGYKIIRELRRKIL